MIGPWGAAILLLVDTQHAGGNLFHGASRPFGMVQAGPCEPNCAGYSLDFLSGADMPKNYSNDFPIVPRGGQVSSWKGIQQASGIPGEFQARQFDGTSVRLSTTARSAMFQIQFPDDGRGEIDFPGADFLEVISPYELRGWSRREAYLIARSRQVFVSIHFSRPMEAFGNASQGYTARFAPGSVISAKVGVSFVSMRNAALNVARENPNWNLAKVESDSRSEWENELSRIQVSGGSEEERRFFYTALYHVFLHPNLSSDVNGEYPGFDGAVHQAGDSPQYVNFSGWDIYRTWMPLVAWLLPSRASAMVQSLVRDSEQGGGAMPRWPAGTVETGVMEGGSATPIVAQAYAFGARNFDVSSAWRAIVATELTPGAKCQGVEERPGLETYLRQGYLPFGEDRIGRQSVALTLDDAIGEFAGSRLGFALGDFSNASRLAKLSGNWRNLWDPSSGYLRTREADGQWHLPFDPDHGDMDGFTEGNAVQYLWNVPQDPAGLIQAIGGDAVTQGRLDRFFSALNSGEDAATLWLGNEPGFFAPWLYNWTSSPFKTQALTRRILAELFVGSKPWPGQDDLGSLSAWGVWAALGLYPATPGVPGFVTSSPIFPRVEVRREGFPDLLVTSTGSGPYVQSLWVDARPVSQTYIPVGHSPMVIHFELGERPSQWGSPPSVPASAPVPGA